MMKSSTLQQWIVEHSNERRPNLSELRAILRNHTPCAALVFANGANALHWACMGQSPSIVKTLLQYNPTLVNRSDNKGRTPLHWACTGGNLNICEMLLHAHADPLVCDKGKKVLLI